MKKSAKRVFDNYSSDACILPVLKVLSKSHKPFRPDGNSQMRPVVGAYSCMTLAYVINIALVRVWHSKYR